MTNYPFKSLDEHKDVVIRYVRKVLGVFGPLPRKVVLKVMNIRGRDNARTPMQWSAQRTLTLQAARHG